MDWAYLSHWRNQGNITYLVGSSPPSRLIVHFRSRRPSKESKAWNFNQHGAQLRCSKPLVDEYFPWLMNIIQNILPNILQYIYIVGIIHDGNLYWPTQNEMKQENWTLLNWPTRPPLSMDNSFYRLFHRGEKWGRHFPWIYSDDMFPRGPSRRSIWCPSRAIGSPEDQRITAMISSEKEVVPVTGRKKGRKNWVSCCWWSLEISQVAGKSMEVLMGKSYIYINHL